VIVSQLHHRNDRLAVAVVLLTAMTTLRFAYREGPLPGHTGGFGEPTCQTCHAGNPLNDSLGRVRLIGIPEIITPDSSYTLSIALERPEMNVGGFQLGARFPDGSQAGSFHPVSETTQAIPGASGLEYVQHARAGSSADSSNSLVWTLIWRAPANFPRAPKNAPSASSSPSAILFHVAANASNDDNSEFGDHIYTAVDTARTGF
jgi:hypothetical protein